MDVEFLELSESLADFGGMYWTADSQPVIYLRDPSSLARRDAAESAIRGFVHLRGLPFEKIHSFQKAEFTWRDLYNWREELRAILNTPGVTGLGIDETKNRILLTVESNSYRSHAYGEISRLNIPANAVRVELRAPAKPLGCSPPGWHSSPSDCIRPLGGGLKIRNPSSATGVCTYSFNAGPYTVVPAHCTTAIGVVHNDVFYQPSSGSSQLMGTEISDPSPFPCSFGNCRWSDSALVWRQGSAEQGRIYKLCTNVDFPHNIIICGYDMITEEAGWPIMGQGLAKTGFVTGQTVGTVAQTCWDVPWVQGIVLLCQDLIEDMVNAPGDSGAPISTNIDPCLCTPDNRKLYGMLVGVSGGEVVMSAMYNIEYELVYLNTTM